jgi:ribosomal protein S18 acetylase RimI-like enzyme
MTRPEDGASKAPIVLRRLRGDEIGAASLMLARTFVTDVFPALLADDVTARFEASRWAFEGFLRYGLAFGEVWVAGDLEGITIWWAPAYVEPDDEGARLVGLDTKPEVLTDKEWQRFNSFGVLSAEVHHASVQGPHWYLNTIGVVPEAQGKGVGTALLDAMFERLDREGLPAYLDTGTDENVNYYKRRGFVVQAERIDPETGIRIRGMRRDPHSSK